MNECGQSFAIGRRFGSVIYTIDEFESYVWSIEEKREEFFEGIRGDLWAEAERINEEAETSAQKEYVTWLAEELPTRIAKRPDDIKDEEWSELTEFFIDAKRSEIFNRHADGASDAIADAEPPLADELGISFRPKKSVALWEATKSLLETDLVNRCLHARGLLERLSQIEGRLVFDLTGDQDVEAAQRVTIPHLANARMVLWLALGEILESGHVCPLYPAQPLESAS